MGLCLDAARELTMVEQRAGKDFKPLAKHRRSHWSFTAGRLRLSEITPQSNLCHHFSSGQE